MNARALIGGVALLMFACAPDVVQPAAGECDSMRPLWHRFEALPFDQHAPSIAVDIDGSVTVAEISRGALTLRRVDAEGVTVWERIWPGDAATVQLAAAPAGHVHVVATIGESIELHTGEVRSASDYFAFFARLDARGDLVWVRTSVGGHALIDAAIGVGATLVVAGRMQGDVFLGGATHDAVYDTTFLARYDQSGELLTETTIGGDGRGNAVVGALASTPDANVYAALSSNGEVDLGGEVRGAPGAVGRWVVLALDHGLNYRWAALVEAELAGLVALDADADGVVAAGASPSASSTVVRFDTAGRERSRSEFPDRRILTIHLEADGSTVLGGDVRHEGTRFGFSPFIAAFDGADPIWSRTWDEASGQVTALARTRDGFVLAGDFHDVLQLNDGTRLMSEGRDSFVVSTQCGGPE